MTRSRVFASKTGDNNDLACDKYIVTSVNFHLVISCDFGLERSVLHGANFFIKGRDLDGGP